MLCNVYVVWACGCCRFTEQTLLALSFSLTIYMNRREWRRGRCVVDDRSYDWRAVRAVAQHRTAHDSCCPASRGVLQASARVPHPAAGWPAHPYQGNVRREIKKGFSNRKLISNCKQHRRIYSCIFLISSEFAFSFLPCFCRKTWELLANELRTRVRS